MSRERDLIANIQAGREYIKSANLTLTERQAQQRQIKAWERDLVELGGTVPPEAPKPKATPKRLAPALRVNAGYVVMNDRDQPGQAIHATRDSCAVVERYGAMGFVREATQDELDRLGPLWALPQRRLFERLGARAADGAAGRLGADRVRRCLRDEQEAALTVAAPPLRR